MTGLKEPFKAAVILNRKSEKQTTILYDIPENTKDICKPVDLVIFLLNRWKQENFFKYALQEVDINQTHGLQLGAEEDAYYIPNIEYTTNLLASQQKLIKRVEKLQSQKKGFEERYFTLKRRPTWEKHLTRKQYLKILAASEETSLTLTDVSVQLKNTPQIVPYTKKDGSTYSYLDFSRINLMNALKAAVYNMRYEMRDMVKPFFKDYREIGKFLDVLTQTGGYYVKGEEHNAIYLNPLETPAYQVAASQLILKINEMTPKVLGTVNKKLVILFKE